MLLKSPPNQERDPIDILIEQITIVPEGSYCFLCKTTDKKECIWDEIVDDMTMEANNIIVWNDTCEPRTKQARVHRAVRYHLYLHYMHTVSSWSHGQGRVRVPICVEQKIKRAYPGDGKFVGFKALPNRKQQWRCAMLAACKKPCAPNKPTK